MGDPDKGDRLPDRHVLAVDITRPHIADALFTLQIVLRDLLHRDGGVFEMLCLPADRLSFLKTGVKNHKDDHGDHDEYIDDRDPAFFHRSFNSPHVCFQQ